MTNYCLESALVLELVKLKEYFANSRCGIRVIQTKEVEYSKHSFLPFSRQIIKSWDNHTSFCNQGNGYATYNRLINANKSKFTKRNFFKEASNFPIFGIWELNFWTKPRKLQELISLSSSLYLAAIDFPSELVQRVWWATDSFLRPVSI